MTPRVYCQALCSGFARLYEQRHQFSDVTLLANGVEARGPRWAHYLLTCRLLTVTNTASLVCVRVRHPLGRVLQCCRTVCGSSGSDRGKQGAQYKAYTVARTALCKPVQGEDCVQVPGHRVVLSACSRVFCAMLERWVGDRGEHPTVLVRSWAHCWRRRGMPWADSVRAARAHVHKLARRAGGAAGRVQAVRLPGAAEVHVCGQLQHQQRQLHRPAAAEQLLPGARSRPLPSPSPPRVCDQLDARVERPR